jgi:hypothetical protein
LSFTFLKEKQFSAFNFFVALAIVVAGSGSGVDCGIKLSM